MFKLGNTINKGKTPWNKGVLVQKICITCKKEYGVHPFRAAASKSCSRACRKYVRQCYFCHGSFNGRAGQKFCSLGCSSKAKKGKMPKNISMIMGSNKGKKASVETRLKQSVARLGKSTGRLGYKATEAQKLALSVAHMGQRAWNKGLKVPQMTGENHPRWVIDRSKLKQNADDNKQRKSSAYNNWSKCVKNRDGWKCKMSNSDCSGRVEAHHILSWREFKELRYEINNGITLCHAHHPRGRVKEKQMQDAFQALVLLASKATF